MMKKCNISYFMVAGALALASCSGDLDSPSSDVNDGYLRVKGTINELNTRASGISWEANDQIGVSGGTYSNVLYTYNNAFSTSTPIKVASETSFTAYYPYSENAGEVSFKVVDTQGSPVKQSTIDFMFAGAQTATKDKPEVTFNFNHKMSQLTLTVEDKTGELGSAKVNLSLMNAPVDGTFNTTTGEVTMGSTRSTVKIGEISFAKATTIILPSGTNFADGITAVVEVTSGENTDTYAGELKPALKAGTQYSYTLSINESDPDLGVGGTIQDWEKVEGGDVDMGKSEKPYELAVGDFLLNDGTTIAPSKYAENSQKVIGVVYYVGNPQPSYLYSDVVTERQDILKSDFPNATKGLAIALVNANDDKADKFNDAKDNYKTWFETHAEDSNANDLYLGLGYGTSTVPSQMLGYNNTIIMKRVKAEGTYTSLNTTIGYIEDFNSQNTVSGASDWYLPSYAEFEYIKSVYSTVSASFSKTGKTLPTFDEVTEDGKHNLVNEKFYWTSDFRSAGNQWASLLQEPTDSEASKWATSNSNGTKGWYRLAIAF